MSSSFDINEILICLKNTYSSSDKNIRLQSEQKLSKLKDENIVTFATKLIDLLKSSKIDHNLKIAIILLLKRGIKEKIEKEELENDSCNKLIQLYITILVNPILTNKELENLNETFGYLLNNTSGEILLEIIKYINKEITSMPLGSVNGVISILLSIIGSKTLSKKYFLSGLEEVLSLSLSMIQNLYNEYEKINIEQNFEDYLKFNNIFSNSFELFFQCNFKASKRFSIKDENIMNLFNNLFIIGAKILVNVKAKDNNRIISWTGNDKIDKNINSMKIKIIKFLNLQVNDLPEIIMDKNKIEMHDQLIKIILSNLEWIIMNKYTYLMKLESDSEEQYYPDHYYSFIISYMFIYLRRIFSKDNYISDYTIHYNNMYKNILLPLLLITNIEEEIALDNETFNGYSIDINDIIFDNKEKKIKSSLAGLIKVFCTKNMVCYSFMVKYTVGLLDFLVNNINNLNDKTLFDQNDIIILLLKAYPKEKIICALILSLNIISDSSKDKNNYQNEFLIREFFERSFDSFIKNITYPCLKHQIILFINNYSLRFFEPDSNAFEANINYLFTSLFEMKYLLISNTSADTIQQMFSQKTPEEYNIKETLLKVATNNSSNFENYISNTQISNFFDVLYQIMLNFEKTDNEFFKRIFEKICKRIHVEVERHFRLKFKVKKERNKIKKKANEKTNLNDYNIIINKCFNIIRMLMHIKDFVINNYELIENSLAPLVSYMNKPETIEFDEDIITIIYLIITHNGKLTPVCFGLIKNLYKYCDKVGGLLLDLYVLINAYLAYGTEQILSNEEYLLGIISVFNSGINGINFTNSAFYTCILIQTWLINCTKIPNQYLSQLINNIITKINKIIQNYLKKKSLGDELYHYLGYVTLILCGLINYSPIIISELEKTNNKNSLEEWLNLIRKVNEPGFEYEIKVIIYSICVIIEKGIITGDINYLLNVSVELLKCQENNSKFELKKNSKLGVNFVDDDEEDSQNDNDNDNEDELTDFKEIKDLISRTINPIKDYDEFNMFRELLTLLKSKRNDIYTAWENSLTQDKKNDVNKIYGTKRIIIQNSENNSIQVARRILTIKRSNNNN